MESKLYKLAKCAVKSRKIASQLLPAVVGPSQNVIVEYSSPNVAKPFHLGHLRGTLQGQFMSNILRSAGHKVTSLNWLGDWGTQFGLLTLAWQTWGDQNRLDDKEPLMYLHELYVRANMKALVDPAFADSARSLFARMEQGDSKAMHFWQLANEVSRREFDKLYEFLNVQFDEVQGERQFAARADQLVDELVHKGVAVESNGAIGVFVDGKKDEPYFVTLRKSDDSSVYISRDITSAIDRHDRWQPDRMLYVVDHAQTDHFTNMQKVLEKMGHGEIGNKIEHVKCGRIQEMSSRTGQIVYVQLIFDLALRRTRHSTKRSVAKGHIEHKDVQPIARQLAKSLVVGNLLKERRTAEHLFSELQGKQFEKFLQLQGDTLVYVQCAHSELCSVLNRFVGEDDQSSPLALHHWVDDPISPVSFDRVTTRPDIVEDIVNHLITYSDTLYHVHQELDPCRLVQYLFKLSRLSRQAYSHLRVAGQDEMVQIQTLALFRIIRDVMADALRIICLDPQTKT